MAGGLEDQRDGGVVVVEVAEGASGFSDAPGIHHAEIVRFVARVQFRAPDQHGMGEPAAGSKAIHYQRVTDVLDGVVQNVGGKILARLNWRVDGTGAVSEQDAF